MTTRARIVAEARTWLGTRWHHQARAKGVGCDCIGLVAGVALALDLPGARAFSQDAACQGYGRTPNRDMLLEACGRYLLPVPRMTAKPGDILLFSMAGQPHHFGIVSQSDPRYMVHAYAQSHRVVENRVDVYWQTLLFGAFSFQGVD